MPDMVLQTQRVRLRPLTIADAPAVFAYAGNIDLLAQTPWEPHTSLAQTQARLHYHQSLITSAATTVWGIEYLPLQRIIGECGITIEYNATADIHYILHPQWHKQGLATEACATLIAYLRTMNTPIAITASIMEHNGASQRVAQRLGLHHIGFVEHQWYARGIMHGLHLYERTLI